MRRPGGRARRWPTAAAALVAVLVVGAAGPAWADTSPVPPDPGTVAADPASTVVVDAVAAVGVHAGAGCTGPESSTVAGDFSVGVSDLLGGPLAAVTVRSDTLVVSSAVVMLDGQGSGCTDVAAIPAGAYQVTASIGDVAVSTPVVVPAPAEPPATTEPAPPTAPDPAPPTETLVPPDPLPTTDPPAPDPVETSPARSEAPLPSAPVASPSATPPTTTIDTGPEGSRAAGAEHQARTHQSQGRAAAPTAPAAAPVAAAPSPSPTSAASTTVKAVLDSTKRAGRKVVSVLVSSDRPTAVTIAGFLVLEILGVALLVAFVALVVARAPRRRD